LSNDAGVARSARKAGGSERGAGEIRRGGGAQGRRQEKAGETESGESVTSVHGKKRINKRPAVLERSKKPEAGSKRYWGRGGGGGRRWAQAGERSGTGEPRTKRMGEEGRGIVTHERFSGIPAPPKKQHAAGRHDKHFMGLDAVRQHGEIMPIPHKRRFFRAEQGGGKTASSPPDGATGPDFPGHGRDQRTRWRICRPRVSGKHLDQQGDQASTQ
jgi:hypothetical protein